MVELTKEEKALRMKELSSTSYVLECSCLHQRIRESARTLCDSKMEMFKVMDKLEEMEENPNMYSAKAIKRRRDYEATLEKFIQSETVRLEKFQEELNRFLVRKEKGSGKEKGSSTGRKRSYT